MQWMKKIFFHSIIIILFILLRFVDKIPFH